MSVLDDANMSLLSPTPDDDDTYSTKVYFGPLQSPEKKLASLFNPQANYSRDQGGTYTSSPSRRSPPLSASPQPRDSDGQIQTEQEELDTCDKDSVYPWQGTPLHNILRRDEPSSAIVDRIIRAHDNPSPPPKSIRPSSKLKKLSKLNEMILPTLNDLQNSSRVPPRSSGPIVEAHSGTPTPPHIDTALLSPCAFPNTQDNDIQLGSPHNTAVSIVTHEARAHSEPYLISLEDSVLLPSEQTALASPPAPANRPQETVDDLLFSPFPRQLSNYSIGCSIQSDSQPMGTLSPLVPSTPRRRSPRLSALPASQPIDYLTSPERKTKAPSPRSPSGLSRKRLRNGMEKFGANSPASLNVELPIASDGADSDGGSYGPSRKVKRSRKRIKRENEIAEEMKSLQLAESLSPESARILTTLMTPTKTLSVSPQDIYKDTPIDAIPGAAGQPLESNQQPIDTFDHSLFNIQRTSSESDQLSTPVANCEGRNLLPPTSPVKLILTPAIEESDSVSQSHAPPHSPQGPTRPPQGPIALFARKIAPGVVYSPVFSRPPIGSPERTPARRIPVSEAIKQDMNGCVKNSISSGISSAGCSLETTNEQPLVNESVTIVSDQPSYDSHQLNLASQNQPVSAPQLLGSSSNYFSKATSSKQKISTTSQMSTRIPRVGAASKSTAMPLTSKLPLPSSRKLKVSRVPSRIPSPSKPSSQKLLHTYSSSSGSDELDTTTNSIQTDSLAPSSSIASTFKPKQSKKLADTRSPKAAIKIRQVIPGMFGGPIKSIQSSEVTAAKAVDDTRRSLSPVKSQQNGPVMARVVRGTMRDFEFTTPSCKTLEAEVRAREQANVKPLVDGSGSGGHCDESTGTFTFRCTVPSRPEGIMDVDGAVPIQLSTDTDLPKAPGDGNTPRTTATSSKARRSTRIRKSVQNLDVFGIVQPDQPATPSSSGRRSGSRKPRTPVPTSLFFHTNGVALKTLTNNNTARNQSYYAQLETQIIRKAGDRPESPTMKLRTISEKQKEEQGKMRAERARRRGLLGSSGMEIDSAVTMDVDEEGNTLEQPLKHRRGPGDDEDYTTPERPVAGKRVKWDKGLETAVYLDEIDVQPIKRLATHERQVPRKSCLALPNNNPLDDLGNIPDAELPLDLIQEKVVVTKYIYDNDEEAQTVEPRSTRRRGKKVR